MKPERSLLRSEQPATSPILSQLIPVHTLPNDFFNIHFNNILPLTTRSSNLTQKITVLITITVETLNIIQKVRNFQSSKCLFPQ
jgi:hypothetical protein